MLRCRDGSYYVGCTTHIEQRMAQHRAGKFGGYTSTRLPVELVWVAETFDVRDAIELERKMKRWSRAKKEAVIEGRWELLPALSRRGFKPRGIDTACFETPAAPAPQDD
jgi:putative endonuclease